MKKVLITGITGRSGMCFAEILQNESETEFEYIAVVRSEEKANELSVFPKITPIIGDLTDEAFLADATKGIDTVFHIAGIKMSVSLTKAAIENHVRRIILVHTTGIYSKFKAASEEYLEIEKNVFAMLSESETIFTVLRPTMIYGNLKDPNMSKFIKMVDKLRVFPVVDKGTFALQPVNIRDLGKAYYQVLTNEESTKNKLYDLSGGTVIDLIDILKLISRLLGKKTVFVSVPSPLACFAAKMLYALSLKKIDYRERVQRLTEPRAYGHEEAAKEFGYCPMPFYDGIKTEVEEYKRNK